ncbi:hypothetical protein HYU08_00675 [Candidatus Woesearchaeota archaeon]|nr:hypothetical protein [Candidatus Woesearchaeota archaeon]
MEKILFRAVIEVLGKPKEHVDASLKRYMQNLKEKKQYQIVKEDYADLKKHEDGDLWMAFVELEARTNQVADIIDFCFDYMPSIIEIIEPEELKLSSLDVSAFLNDLQAKLHGVDMLAKQMKMENQLTNNSLAKLLNNYIVVLLRNNNLTSKQLSTFTGMNIDILEDYMDKMIDEGKIDLKDGLYFLKESAAEMENGRESEEN